MMSWRVQCLVMHSAGSQKQSGELANGLHSLLPLIYIKSSISDFSDCRLWLVLYFLSCWLNVSTPGDFSGWIISNVRVKCWFLSNLSTSIFYFATIRFYCQPNIWNLFSFVRLLGSQFSIDLARDFTPNNCSIIILFTFMTSWVWYKLIWISAELQPSFILA